jgi:hypothetical protein
VHADRAYRAADLPAVCRLLEEHLAAGRAAGVSVAELRQVLARPVVDAERNAREEWSRRTSRCVTETHVGTGSWNTATIGLLESVGYRRVDDVLAYARTF